MHPPACIAVALSHGFLLSNCSCSCSCSCSAEATDIANAVLDGVDAIMLGAETYRGNYALETVNTGAQLTHVSCTGFDGRGGVWGGGREARVPTCWPAQLAMQLQAPRASLAHSTALVDPVPPPLARMQS